MDTINNQPINNQAQPVPQPQNSGGNIEQQTTQYQNPDLAKGKSGKTILILIVLLIIVIGIVAYLIFVNTMANKPQNTSINAIQPSPTSVPPPPTSQAIDEFEVENPETDLKALDDAASTL